MTQKKPTSTVSVVTRKDGDRLRDRQFKHGSRALASLLRLNQVDGRSHIAQMLRDIRERLAAP